MTTNILINSLNNTTDEYKNQVKINLSEPLDIFNKKVRLIECNIWYETPNVSSLLYNNNTVNFTYNAVNYSCVLLEGLYSLTDINESLVDFFINNGLPQNLMVLEGDEATSKITLQIKTGLNFSITFSTNNILFKEFLGFYSNASFNTNVNKNIDGSNVASLNRLTNYLISCSFAGGSSTYNNSVKSSSIIAQVAINKSVGALLSYQPFYPMECTTIGNSVSEIFIEILDQDSKRIKLLSPFTLRLEIY